MRSPDRERLNGFHSRTVGCTVDDPDMSAVAVALDGDVVWAGSCAVHDSPLLVDGEAWDAARQARRPRVRAKNVVCVRNTQQQGQ